MSSPSSPFSSQPEPARDSNSPQNRPARRLQTPAERFGVAPILPLPIAPENPAPDEIFAAPTSQAPARSRRERHQRKRYRANRSEKKPLEKAHFEKKPIAGREEHPKSAQSAQNRRKKASPRAKTRFQRNFKRLAILAVGFFAIQTAIAALTAPQFRLSEVEISGLNETPRADVETLLAPLWGQNVFRAPRAAVADAVETLPTVERAKIQLHAAWPPRAELVVTERKAILKVGNGAKWWVADRAGVLYRRAKTEDANLYRVEMPAASLATRKQLPTSFWARAVELHHALQADNELAAQNLTEMSAAPQGTAPSNHPFWQLRRISFGTDGEAILEMPSAPAPVLATSQAPNEANAPQNALLIRLGDEEWAPKLARARQALGYFKRTGRRAAELDLVSFRRPRWRPVVLESNLGRD